MPDALLTSLVAPFGSALVGAACALVGGYFAMRTEIAVFQAKLDGLHEAINNIRRDLDSAHARIDALFGRGGLTK